MAATPVAAPTPERSGELTSIAQSVRSTFQTIEGMTQSFIREAIMRGIFEPGERLNQDDIAETLGISRMPVRASLRQLEGEGLVRISPHRGATVSVLRPDEIAEIYDMRVMLESYLLRHAIDRLTDDTLKELEGIAKQVDRGASRADHIERRQDFYRRLYDLADRPRVQASAEQLRAAVGRYLLLIRMDEPTGHDKLIGHLSDRNKRGAVEWLTSHLNRVSKVLQGTVSEDGSVRRNG
jgi:DNA-binding GntR family transcriptional regulator